MFRLCRELGYPHPDYLGRYLNRRQLDEWAAFERIEPFEPERADIRQSLDTFWVRETWLEKHTGQPKHYRVNFEGEPEKTEADILMDEVKEMFSL
jgi:hypothetical protein